MCGLRGGEQPLRPTRHPRPPQALKARGLEPTAAELAPFTQMPSVMAGLSSVMQPLLGVSLAPRACRPAELVAPGVVGYDMLLGGREAGVLYLHPGTGYGTRVLQLATGGPAGGKLLLSIGLGSPDIRQLPPAALLELVHELGHAAHLLLSSGQPLLHGSALFWPRDLLELPSQLLEQLAMHPASLARACRHAGTGQPMPAELAARLAGHLRARHRGALALQEKAAVALVDVLYAEHGGCSDFWGDVHRSGLAGVGETGAGAGFRQLAVVPTAARLGGGRYYAYLYAWCWACQIWELVCPAAGAEVDVAAMGVVVRELLAPGNRRSPLASLELCFAGLGREPGEAVRVRGPSVAPVVAGAWLRASVWTGA
jgi:hypothetical protein